MKIAAAILCMTLMLTVCGANQDSHNSEPSRGPAISSPAGAALEPENPEVEKETPETDGAMKMNVRIGDDSFTATLEDNPAVHEWMEILREGPVTVEMSDYSGFEKVGPLGRSFTTSDTQTTAAAGDIVLYNGNSIVLFYGGNSWSYTRIGKIDDLTGWAGALGGGDVTVVFTLAE